MNEIQFLRRDEAAAYIRENYKMPCAKAYLDVLASVGGGPAFRRIGRWPVYERSDLDAWAKARMTKKVRSTAELRGAA